MFEKVTLLMNPESYQKHYFEKDMSNNIYQRDSVTTSQLINLTMEKTQFMEDATTHKVCANSLLQFLKKDII